MYVKCQTACVVWCSLTRNLLPLVTAFHGKNCFGTCLGYHYLHRQKCKIEPENDAFQQGISFTTGGAFSGSMQVPCWFLQGCSPDVFPKKNGTIFDDLCKTSASFLHTVAQWHGRLTRRPPGSIFPTDVFSGSKVLERERERVFWNSICLENSRCCYSHQLYPWKQQTRFPLKKDGTFVLQVGKLSSTMRLKCLNLKHTKASVVLVG